MTSETATPPVGDFITSRAGNKTAADQSLPGVNLTGDALTGDVSAVRIVFNPGSSSLRDVWRSTEND
jgi:hypothetical protein